MKLLGDMGVSRGVIRWLTANGHDATHLADQNLQKLSDSLIFAKASAEHRVVLTFDLDFGEILALSGDRIVSVVFGSMIQQRHLLLSDYRKSFPMRLRPVR
ncbi:MAG TPA: DUF5615 family PIN-like protein [Tepidisphaeraceae bacterium]|jgi:predicted nuclease of predicted toxin-antitoxin system